MDSSSTALASFFEQWQIDMSAGNIPAVVANFAEVFLYASPQGAQAVRAGDFALALPKRKQLFDRLQSEPTTLVSLTETKLDRRFTLARVQWRMAFAGGQAGPQQILVDSTYIVNTGDGVFKIVFYLAHQDILEILKERGILTIQAAP